MIVKTSQTYRFTLADGTSVHVTKNLQGDDRRPWVASPQTVPDGITTDPEFIRAAADGSLVISSEPMLSGIQSGENLGATALTANANYALTGIPTAEAFGAIPL